VATRRVAQPDEVEGWRLLRELCADVLELRRGDHHAERFELEREQSEEQLEKRLWEWAQKPENKICGVSLTPEQREQAICEIYGFPYKPGAPA
jgi:hypothetical protein